ncbi:glycosyltransferase family 2 protein [Planctomycetota bacterium]
MPHGIDVIILTFNKWEYTQFCLNGLRRTECRPLRLIMVDNGSTDGTPEKLEEFSARAASDGIQTRIICNSENVGAIAGRNQALEHIENDFVIFLDNDVVPVAGDWAGDLIAFLDNQPDAGAVSPKLIYPAEPFLIQCAGCDVAPTGRVNFRGRGEARNHADFNRVKAVQALITACMAVPARTISEIGEFDPLFAPVQFEDIDYCYRIRQSGKFLFYTPEVEMYHFENVTTSRTASLNSAYNTVKNGLKFKRKWKHVFSLEKGPSEQEMDWKDIPGVNIDEIDRSLFPGLTP